MKSSKSFKTVTLSIDEVRPYWRNPRIITDEAVDAVRSSIEEYGYIQPIVVDAKNVIVVGHVRYVALRRMGVETVEVVKTKLTDREAKELRIIDNRSSEFSSWDYAKLMEEVEKAGSVLVDDLFPEASPDDFEDDGREWVLGDSETQDGEIEFICPSCFHEWEQTVTREQIMEGKVTKP